MKKTKTDNVSKIEKFKKGVNDVINDILDNSLDSSRIDLFANIDYRKLIDLKKALSDINNIITLITTNAFLKKLNDDGFINSNGQYKRMFDFFNGSNANSNGFDIEYPKKIERKGKKIEWLPENSNEDIKILAEVKCNIPINEGEFGKQQNEGIITDILHLYYGKTKSKLTKKDDIKDYYKFMVILDCGNNCYDALEKILKSPSLKVENIAEYNEFNKKEIDEKYKVNVNVTKNKRFILPIKLNDAIYVSVPIYIPENFNDRLSIESTDCVYIILISLDKFQEENSTRK